jgi:hypothetical protein
MVPHIERTIFLLLKCLGIRYLNIQISVALKIYGGYNNSNIMHNFLKALIILIVIGAVLFGLSVFYKSPPVISNPNIKTYSNSQYGFSLSYLANPELTYPFNGQTLTGNLQVITSNPQNIPYNADVLVLIPITNIDQFLQTGQVADFREATLELRVDNSLPNCTAADYITQSSGGINTAPPSNLVTIGGHNFQHIDVSGAGAGNFYNDQVYVGKVNNECYVAETIVHTVNCGNYDPGKCVTIDKSFIQTQIDAIFSTIKFFNPSK